MATWSELQLWFDGQRTQDELFQYKKAHLIPTLNRHGIARFLVLDESEFILVRVDASAALVSQLKATLRWTLEPLFRELKVQRWSPEDDARNRILAARSKVIQGPPTPGNDGFAIDGKSPSGDWLVSPADLVQQTDAFASFMTEVAAHFTKHYITSMPYRVSDRWLLSVFVHLLLDSISTWQQEEDEAREFRYI